MEYVIPVDKWFDPKVGTRSKLSIVRKISSCLDQEHRRKLKDSCFGKLLKIEEVKFSGKLMNNLLLRRIARQRNHTKPMSNDEELSFKIGDETLCFSLMEFTLITGLNPGKEEDYTTKIPKENRLLNKYFEGAESVTPNTLKEAFENAKDQEDKYKLGLVLIYENVLRAKELGTSIEVENLAIVDDLEVFYEYQWGRKYYNYTTDHTVEAVAIEDEDDGIHTIDDTLETALNEDEDDGIRTIDDTLETTSNEDRDGGAPTVDDILCVVKEVEQLCGDIDTSDAKVKVNEEDCTRDDNSIEVSENDDQLLEENDAGFLGRRRRKHRPGL